MTEWPPAERLRQALRNADVGQPNHERGWQEVRQRIEHNFVPTPATPIVQVRSRLRALWPKAVVVAAAAVAIVAFSLALWPGNEDATEVSTVADEPGLRLEGEAPPAVVSEATARPIPAPQVALADLNEPCSAVPWDRYSADSGKAVLWAGGMVGATGAVIAPGRFVLTEDHPDDFVERTNFPAPDPTLPQPNPGLIAYGFGLIAGPSAGPAIDEIFSDWNGRVCGITWNMLVLDGDLSPSLAAAPCDTAQSRLWGALALVGTDLQPPPCARVQRAMLVDQRSAADPTVEKWAQAHECQDSGNRTDNDGNTITEWSGCAVTLIHVQVSADDPWDAIIEGVPTLDYLDRLFEIAN